MSQASTAHAKTVELGKQVVRMTTAAGSGHPSSALALGHIIVELMYRQMRFDPADPWNPGNDRLVLSVGHSVPIVYAAYADLGGAVGPSSAGRRLLKVDELTTLRELRSVLDGHPNPAEGFPFFDAATGSLGQGLSVAAGLALAARLDRIDKRIYVIVGDGESREGQVWEAMDFIVDHRLNNVCVIFSCNGEGQAGKVSAQQSASSIAAKAKAFNWQVLTVEGHDPDALSQVLDRARAMEDPVAIVARTVKGWGVDLMRSSNFHGKPVPAAELSKALSELDETARRLGATSNGVLRPPSPNPAPRAVEPRTISIAPFEHACERAGLGNALKAQKIATRAAYGVALVALGEADARVVALDGDVSNSTFADRFAKAFPDRYFECKIAEQNMISVAAGLSAGGRIPFASSFGKFIARAVDQIDMALISRANVKIVGSHCGVSLAADGPSQMAVSDVAYFRSMTRVDDGSGRPACRMFNPCDAVSAYRCTELLANTPGLGYLRTHRPDASFVYPLDERFDLGGCKQVRRGEHLTLVSGGYMLHTVLRAADRLADAGVRCNVFDAFAFPLDAGPILLAARSAGGRILTAEDNYGGGLHSELAEAAAAVGDVRVEGLTVRRIPKSAKTPDEVFEYAGVGLDRIIERAKALAAR